MLEALSDKLSGVFQKLGSHGSITEKDLDEAMREVRIALLEADVNFKVVRQFVAAVRERALGAEVMKSLSGTQQVIAIVNEELVNILGGSPSTLAMASKPPTVIMLVGLKGSGKTTTAAKLALHLRKNGSKPLLVAADPYRMAAGEQLRSLGKQLGMPVFEPAEKQKLPDLCTASLVEAKRQGASVVIVDTAGRSTIDGEMMSEVSLMRDALNPNEIMLDLDAMTGQEAVNVAQEFHDQLNVTGIIIKKMGPLTQLVDMIPGLGNVKRQMKVDDLDEGFWKRAEAVVYSMTADERKHPEIINGSRRRRIAIGSGTTPQEVNRLLNQWKEAKKIMQTFASNRSGFLNVFGGR